jgi:rhodanese-related sulfurtransferase
MPIFFIVISMAIQRGATVFDLEEGELCYAPQYGAAKVIQRDVALAPWAELTGELPRDREIWVQCAAGQRSYYACRILSQHGFQCRNLSGGYQTYQVQHPG